VVGGCGISDTVRRILIDSEWPGFRLFTFWTDGNKFETIRLASRLRIRMWCVILQPKGTSRNAVIPAPESLLGGGVLDVAQVGAILRRTAAPVLIGTWKWNGYVVHLFGYKTGKAGTENKHEIPPPHDKDLLFGEAIVLATKGGTVTTFNSSEYTKFYNEAYGGFEEVGSDDSEEEGDEEDEEEEEEEEEVAAEVEEKDEEEEPEAGGAEEEEDEPVRPAPKPAAVPKAKRGGKKAPSWYTFPDMEPEAYVLRRD